VEVDVIGMTVRPGHGDDEFRPFDNLAGVGHRFHCQKRNEKQEGKHLQRLEQYDREGVETILLVVKRAFHADRHQLIFTPAVCATFAHLSISALMKAPNSGAVIDSGTTPCFAHDSLISVEVRIFRISVLRRSTTGFGVAAGATIPTQPEARKPGTPASQMGGTSGRKRGRSSPGGASATTKTSPAPGALGAVVSDIITTRPPRVALPG